MSCLTFIPSSEAQPSLNLSQAEVVYGYEQAMASRRAVLAPGPALADDAQLRQARTSMEQQALLRAAPRERLARER